jgi:hypothetical protein
MKAPSVKNKISVVLMENKNGFLSIEEIAKRAYGDSYMKETKNHLNALVRRNITHAIADLSQEGYLVIKDLEPCVNSEKLSHKKVNGYKIADAEDIEMVVVNLKSRRERLEIAAQKKLDFEYLATDNKIYIENK